MHNEAGAGAGCFLITIALVGIFCGFMISLGKNNTKTEETGDCEAVYFHERSRYSVSTIKNG